MVVFHFLSLTSSLFGPQSDIYTMQTGGYQGAKEKLFFGIVNAFQWASHIFKEGLWHER